MWKIANSTLVVDLGNNSAFIPAAIEIYDLIHEKKTNIRGMELVDPRVELGDIDFSNFLLDVFIEIKSFSASSKEGVSISLIGRLNNLRIDLPIDHALNLIDHVIFDETWYPINAQQLSLIKGVFDDLSITNNRVTLRQYIQIKQRLDKDGYVIENVNISLDLRSASEDVRDLVIPGLNAQLYPYQKVGVNWLNIVTNNDLGCILGDEMGLGKTMQILSLLLLEKEKGKRPSLLIITASLIENWKREILRFAPSINYYVHHGGQRTALQKDLRNVDLVVTTYDVAIIDAFLLKTIDWNLVVLDEAHSIRNPNAERTRAIKGLSKRAAIAVTGTPLVNKFRDIWSVSDFANEGYLGDIGNFENIYRYDVESARKIKDRISPILLRREVLEVAKDLPSKIVIPEWIQFTEEEALLYDRILDRTLSENVPSFTNLVYLRMFCCHPSLIFDDYEEPVEYSAKFARLLELLDEIFTTPQKVLIFSDFVKIIDILEREISSRYGVLTRKIYGQVGSSNRQKHIDEFTEIDGRAALILNYQAGGVGLNIQAANHVILYNPVWNPADEDQAIARAYRSGQKNNVMVHRMNYVNSIEEIIDGRLNTKRTIIDNTVEGVKGDESDIQQIWRELQKKHKRK